MLDAGDLWYQGDLMEALLAIGAVDETAEVVAEVTAKADLSRSKWARRLPVAVKACCTAAPTTYENPPPNWPLRRALRAGP